jgi:hypothetical protein
MEKLPIIVWSGNFSQYGNAIAIKGYYYPSVRSAVKSLKFRHCGNSGIAIAVFYRLKGWETTKK